MAIAISNTSNIAIGIEELQKMSLLYQPAAPAHFGIFFSHLCRRE